MIDRLHRPALRIILAALVAAAAGMAAAADPAPLPTHAEVRGFADRAEADLLSNFWVVDSGKDAAPGHILPTHGGYPPGGSLQPGMWEAGTLYGVLYHYYQLTGSDDARRRLAQAWDYIAAHYGDLRRCGERSVSPASDDSGWDARLLLQAHDITGSREALDDAKALVRCAYARWSSSDAGGRYAGLWYSDRARSGNGAEKSLYEIGLALAALQIYEIERSSGADDAGIFYGYALQSHDWIEANLRKADADSLYWADWWIRRCPPAPSNAPCVSGLTPRHAGDIAVAGSAAFLGGNMGMALLQARLFRLTGEDRYRQESIRTSRAILAQEVDPVSGVLYDDRDAWTDGSFAVEWAREALSLDGAPPGARAALYRTAQAIAIYDRTPEGRYGGDWGEQALNPRQPRWEQPPGGPDQPSLPAQLHTSANAVEMIMAAAALPEAW